MKRGDESDAEPSQRRRGSWWPLAALVVVVGLLVVGMAVLIPLIGGSRGNNRPRVEVLLDSLDDREEGFFREMMLELGLARQRTRMDPWEVKQKLVAMGLDAVDDLCVAVANHPAGPARAVAAEALGEIGDPKALPALAEALADPDTGVRSEAEGAIRQFDDRAVPVLIEALGHQKAAVRAAVARRLGEMSCVQAIDPLLGLLGDASGEVRAAVAEALGNIGDLRALSSLTGLLKDKDAEVRVAAAKSLGNLGHPDATASLVGALGDPSVEVRSEAAESLGAIRDPAAVPALIAAMKDREVAVRACASKALGGIKDPRGASVLIAALPGEQPPVRQAIAEALGLLGDRRAIGPLIAALSDGEEAVAAAAAESLGRLRAAEAVEALIAAIGPPETGDNKQRQPRRTLGPQVELYSLSFEKGLREAAVEALGLIGDKRAVGPLLALLKPEPPATQPAKELNDFRLELLQADEGQRVAEGWAPSEGIFAGPDGQGRITEKAIEALGLIGDARAVPALIKLLDDPDDDVVEAAAKALARIGDRRAVAGLAKAIGSRQEESTRGCLVEALGGFGGEVVGALLQAAKDPAASVRRSAYEALGHTGDARALPVLLAAMQTEAPDQRDGVVTALGTLGGPKALEALVEAMKTGDSDVRFEAALALGAMGDARSGDAILPLLKDETWSTRVVGAFALGLLRRTEGMAVLDEALHSRTEWAALAAVVALKRIGTPEATAKLRDGANRARMAPIRAIAAKAADESLPAAMAEALRDDEYDYYAARAMFYLGDADCLPMLDAAAAGSPDATVREVAAQAARRIRRLATAERP